MAAGNNSNRNLRPDTFTTGSNKLAPLIKKKQEKKTPVKK